MGREVVELKLDLINNILLLPNFSPLLSISPENFKLIKEKLIRLHQILNYIEALYDDLIEKRVRTRVKNIEILRFLKIFYLPWEDI